MDITTLAAQAKSNVTQDNTGNFTIFTKLELEEFVRLVKLQSVLEAIDNYYESQKHSVGNRV